MSPTGPPLRIALVHPFSWPEVVRGAERHVADLSWYLAGAGHHVDVITGTDGPSLTSTEAGVTVRRRRHLLPGALARRGTSRVDTFGLAALGPLLRRRYDVVHAFTPSAALAARSSGQTTLYTAVGHPTPDQFGRRPLDRRLLAAAVRWATVTTAVSRASATQISAMFGRLVELLPNGVRLDRFTPRLASRTGPPRVLFSADASDARKGIEPLLRAMVLLRRRRPDTRLQLSGGGDHTWALARLGDEAAGLGEMIDDLGPTVDDMPARYRAATVTVLPSVHEAFGLSLLESLAAGTPVVCNRDGGMPEIVDDERLGRVVNPGDVAALAAAIDSVIVLAGQEETPRRCAEHARQWGWQERTGPAHEAMYRRLRSGRRAR